MNVYTAGTYTHIHVCIHAAHTTQFSEVGYNYLKVGSGAGHLENGGSYVTLMDPSTKDFTIVIETMVGWIMRSFVVPLHVQSWQSGNE